MSNNAGPPSSDAGYSNLELDLDDLDNIDLITNGTRPFNNTTGLTRGRAAIGLSVNRNGGSSSSMFEGSARRGGSRSTTYQPSRAGLFDPDPDPEDDGPDPLRLAAYPNQAGSSRTTALRTARNPAIEDPAAHRRALGLPELAPDATPEERLHYIEHRDRRMTAVMDNRAAARERRREAMEQAIERAPLPTPARGTRPTTSAARERAEEAAAARRAAPADPVATAAQLERRRRVYNILREDGDPPVEGYGSYPSHFTLHDLAPIS